MPIAINGSGTVTGISVGGLPDGIVDTDMIAAAAVTAPKRGPGAILQVVQHSFTTGQFTTTSNSYVDVTGFTQAITPTAASSKILVMLSCQVQTNPSGTYVTISGLSVNITPSSSSNKILVIADVKAGNDGGNGYYLQIVRDSTAIYVGDAATGKQQCIQQTYGGGDTGEGKYGMAKMGGTFLDSPSTTSQITYAVQFLRLGGNSPQTLYVNRVGSENPGEYVGRAASSITAIEVAA